MPPAILCQPRRCRRARLAHLATRARRRKAKLGGGACTKRGRALPAWPLAVKSVETLCMLILPDIRHALRRSERSAQCRLTNAAGHSCDTITHLATRTAVPVSTGP